MQKALLVVAGVYFARCVKIVLRLSRVECMLRWKQRTGIKASGAAIVKVMRQFERLSTPEFPQVLRQLKPTHTQHTRQEALRTLVEALQSRWEVPKIGSYFRKKLCREHGHWKFMEV